MRLSRVPVVMVTFCWTSRPGRKSLIFMAVTGPFRSAAACSHTAIWVFQAIDLDVVLILLRWSDKNFRDKSDPAANRVGQMPCLSERITGQQPEIGSDLALVGKSVENPLGHG